MTFLRSTGANWRLPSFGGAVVISTWRGLIRVQKWPKKIGAPRTRREAARRDIFRRYQALIKRLGPWETETERDAIARHNKLHKGQRGAAALRLRDFQMQRLCGRGFGYRCDDGIVFYPPGVSADASHLLDNVAQVTGGLLIRQADLWDDFPPTQPGHVLVSGSPGQTCSWQAIEEI